MNRFQIVDNNHRKHPNQMIQLPTKGSAYSAGYDLYLNEEITINPGEQKVSWTDVKCFLYPDEFLQVHIRSSLGFKKNIMLSNQVGVIDADYFGNPDNDGNIAVALFNFGKQPITLKAGERVAQGIIQKYPVDFSAIEEDERTGGLGSTGS